MTKRRQPEDCQEAASAAMRNVSEIRPGESSSEACDRNEVKVEHG